MKRILTVLLAVIMALSLVACGGGAGNGGNGGNGGTPDVKNPDYNVAELLLSVFDQMGFAAVNANEEIPEGIFPDYFVFEEKVSEDSLTLGHFITSKDKVLDDAASAMGMMMPPRKDVGIVRAKNISDVEDLKAEIAENLKKEPWTCAPPSLLYVVNSGDYILFVATTTTEFCDLLVEAFESKMTVPLGESISIDFAL